MACPIIPLICIGRKPLRLVDLGNTGTSPRLPFLGMDAISITASHRYFFKFSKQRRRALTGLASAIHGESHRSEWSSRPSQPCPKETTPAQGKAGVCPRGTGHPDRGAFLGAKDRFIPDPHDPMRYKTANFQYVRSVVIPSSLTTPNSLAVTRGSPLVSPEFEGMWARQQIVASWLES